jgi:hypothetical protein
MTQIRLQDNSTEEDDAGLEHYHGILPGAGDSDSDSDSHPGVLRHVTPTLRGKEAYSDAKEYVKVCRHSYWPLNRLLGSAEICTRGRIRG